jgi:hypothetical protein
MPAISATNDRTANVAHYHIPAHISFAVTTDAVIFMDLRDDCYRLLAGPQAHLFRTLSHQTTRSTGALRGFDFDESQQTTPECSTLIATLIAGNILVAGPEPPPRPVLTLPAPLQELTEGTNLGPTHVHTRDIWRFWRACVRSSWILRHRPIERTIRAVEHRRERHGLGGRMDMYALRHHVALFRSLRHLYPRDFLCLFDSLALLEFLALYGFFPNWVFAVSLTPWSAHCWVQHEDVVLNECAEAAARYITVLIV